MTKIKNTKKGMAKKTLSISLAVAMLATSNVPVWAAEDLFTDGDVAVEAFTAEETVEAPVVEDGSEVDAANLVGSELDVSGVELKVGEENVKDGKAAFGSKLSVGGTIAKPDGSKLEKFSYAWRVAGETTAFTEEGSVTNGNYAAMDLDTAQYKDLAGKTIELYIFRHDTDGTVEISNTVIASVTLEKNAIPTTAKLVLNVGDGLVYDGGTYGYVDKASDDKTHLVGISYIDLDNNGKEDNTDWKLSADELSANFNITTVQSAKNAGDKLIIAAEPKAGSEYAQYVNTVYGEAEVKAREWVVGEIVAGLKTPLKYQYTNDEIVIPNDNVVLKEKPDTFANADLSNAVVKAFVPASEVGEVNATINADGTKITNWNLIKKSVFYTTDTPVTIEQRDLSTAGTSISIKHGVIPTGTTHEGISDYLVFKGTETGTPILNLVADKDYTFTVLKKEGEVVNISEKTKLTAGNYTLEISCKSDSKNTKNNQTIAFEVGDVITNVEYAGKTNYKPDYTGSAIEPTKANLGDLTITHEGDVDKVDDRKTVITTAGYDIVDGSYKNNVNASTYDEEGNALTYATVDVKIKSDLASNYAGKTFTLKYEIQPLTVKEAYITEQKTVSYNSLYTKASEYGLKLIVNAKDQKGKGVKGLTEDDYAITYDFETKADGNKIGNKITYKVTITNPNFMGINGLDDEVRLEDKKTTIVAKALTNDMVKVNPSSYVYTGGAIVPEFVVMDGMLVLYNEADFDKGSTLPEYRVVGTEGVNVGTGKVTVEGINNHYSGIATGTFEITPENTSAVKVVIDDFDYTGRQARPRIKEDITVTLNGNDVTSQFDIVGFGENINAGKGTVTLKANSKNFTGEDVVAEFNIIKEKVSGAIDVFNADGIKVTDAYNLDKDGDGTLALNTGAFDFDGTAKTFFTEKLTLDAGTKKATVADFEIKYADNVAGKKTNLAEGTNHYNVAYVYAVAKEGNGFTGNQTITLADGTKITGVVAYIPFAIKNVAFVKQNVSVKNGVYAGGLPVKPEVLVQINGNTLVEGKDYKLELEEPKNSTNHFTDVTTANIFKVNVIGLGGYSGSEVRNVYTWGIDKKDLKDCDVKVVNGVTTVMNGYIPVPVTEYTSTKNEDGTYTVAAVAASKNYVGSVTVKAEGQTADEKPAAPMISKVDVNGNNAKVILSGDCEGAEGYDYVISTDKDCITNKDYAKVNKNKLLTNTNFTYVDQDVYYAYCHAYKRDENGKKIFSDWSEPYAFVVSAITPETPVVTSVKVKGSTVTVTYTEAANADGYDVVLGSAVKTVADEKRPVEYGTLVKKNIKKGVVTATFKNVPKGTYYAGLHAWNRTNPKNNTKVFSPWSNTKKVTVK